MKKQVELWGAAAALFVSGTLSAQTGSRLPWEEYDRLMEASRNIAPLDMGSMFGDKVDLYSGTLSFSATDVSIPGNTGLSVALGRKLSIQDRKGYGVRGYAFADWDIAIPNVNGVFAPNWHDNRCTQAEPTSALPGVPAKEFWAGNQAELPGGGEMLRTDTTRQQPASGGPYPWITTGEIHFSCLSSIDNGSGQGFLAIDANGIKYWLNHMAQYAEPSLDYPIGSQTMSVQRRKNVLYATRIEDRFGNWVAYSYNNTATQSVRLTNITSSDGRSLSLQYDGNGYVSSASDGNRTWTYQYSNHHLSKVIFPDASSWTINLAALSDAQILYTSGDPHRCDTVQEAIPGSTSGSLTHPSGATAIFVIEPRATGRTNVPRFCTNWRPTSNDESDNYPVFAYQWVTLSLASKQLQGPGLPTTQWTYDFDSSYSWKLPPGHTQPYCQSTTCAEPFCTSDSCAGTRVALVTAPNGEWERYIFGNSYRYNEGKLLAQQSGNGPNAVIKDVINTYNYATSGQPYTAKIGTSPQSRGAGFISEYIRPLVKTETFQDDALFVWEVAQGCSGSGIYCLDPFARPTKVVHSGTVATDNTGNNPVLAPHLPPNVTTPSSNTTGNFTVNWTSTYAASTYQLQEQLDGGSWNTAHDGSATSKVFSGKTAGSWGYQVRACNVIGCSAWSPSKITIVTLTPTNSPTLTAPAANTTGSYTVSWTLAATATRYELQQRKDGGVWSTLQDAAATSKDITGQISGNYDYRVRACNMAGCSAYSATATTAVSVVALGVPALSAPSPVQRGAFFTVSWTGVSGATQYILEYTFSGTVYAVYTGAALSAQNEHYTAGTYRYRVKACNASGCGNYSSEKTVVVKEGDISSVSPLNGYIVWENN